jgi:hypothetical protein
LRSGANSLIADCGLRIFELCFYCGYAARCAEVAMPFRTSGGIAAKNSARRFAQMVMNEADG